MKTSKTDRKKFFDNVGQDISNKTESKLNNYQDKLSVKQRKRIVIGMFLITLFAMIGIVTKTVLLKQSGKNPFKEINQLSKSLVNKDSTLIKQNTNVNDLLYLMEVKSQIEKINPDSLTKKDSIMLVGVNQKLDKLMKKQ